ncbi:GNAT family N-acetyltransferase [Polluticoccus soli]|uniref:GNAT family N-acetyltransferase n=1 Tax=Polluticoccus soli TaxID=3034150 RepID=UPI0023E14422|nr:GNAT family N-acetyltransferase [Flavipsychrobacter sp. JY13-12]
MHCQFTPFPTLTSDRVVLRRIELSDDQEIFFQRSDKTMNEFIDRPGVQTVEDARNWINMISGGIEKNELIAWGVALKDKQPLVGGFCLWNLEPETNTAEIGFSLHPEYWGKGLMQEALEAGIKFGFETMQLDTLEAHTHEQNSRSRKLLERNGFVLKGPIAGSNYLVYTLNSSR